MFKKLFCSIFAAVVMVGCVHMFVDPPAHLLIVNCNKWTYVSVAHFTEFDKYGDPTKYEILKEHNLLGAGTIDIDVKPGMYSITYYNKEDKVLEYDSFWVKPGETKKFEYKCDTEEWWRVQ